MAKTVFDVLKDKIEEDKILCTTISWRGWS